MAICQSLTDFVFDGVRADGLLLEAVQIGKELLINKVAEVGAIIKKCVKSREAA
jgi:hypothetical protein